MNLEGLFSKLLANPALTGAGGGLLAGGLVAALGSKHTRRLVGGATKLGAAAAVGALAAEAVRRYRAQAAAPAPNSSASPALDAPAPTPSRTIEPAIERLVIAMLSAARADGEIDFDERSKIDARLATLDIDAETRAYALATLDRPADPHRVAKLAGNEEEAAEIYLVSLCAIEADHWAEAAYLTELQKALGLAQPIIDDISANVRNLNTQEPATAA
jgi:uncharacterized membrane protein YebE (DUF533 family)